ncbi:MAG: exo-alpha-sialidase [Sedimentisphaeraceae bacterium JB056]
MKSYLLIFSMLSIFMSITDSYSRGIEPLANDCKVLYKTENPQTTYIYDPAIAVCPNGRLIGCFSLGGSGGEKYQAEKGSGNAFIYTSDDNGENWDYKFNFNMWHFRPFVAGNKLYIVGHKDDLKVLSSDDWGDNWSETTKLTEKQVWHGSATNVWYKDNYIYMVMERDEPAEMKGGWRVAELAPVLMRGDVNKDLTKRENWTFSSEMVYHDVIDDKELEWFGAPFYPSFYPERKRMSKRSVVYPLGWLEANVVQITDPKHYWYDPSGKTFHIFMRTNTGVTNLGCVIKAVEQEDGSITTDFVEAPSGKKHFYIPFPGGHMKFSVVYDEKTKLYWMVGTQSTDSMTRAELLPEDRFHVADNERRRLVLHFSKNMLDWCFAGVVAIGPSERSSRHYCQMVIKDNDLLIMSRSGDLEAKDAHNGNIVTFHKVNDFRELVY